MSEFIKGCPFCGKASLVIYSKDSNTYKMSCVNFCLDREFSCIKSATNHWNQRVPKKTQILWEEGKNRENT